MKIIQLIVLLLVLSSCDPSQPITPITTSEVAYVDGYVDPIDSVAFSIYNYIQPDTVIVFVHADATFKGSEFKTPEQLIEFFLRDKSKGGRGWSKPGYLSWIDRDANQHFLVESIIDGKIYYKERTWGAKGYNSVSIHVALSTSLPRKAAMNHQYPDTATKEQKQTLLNFLKAIKNAIPNVKVMGHNEVSDKACPCFNVKEWLAEEGYKINMEKI